MMENEQEKTMKVFARGFVGAFLDAEFSTEHVADMRQVTYEELCTDFPGADIQVLEEKENGD